MKHIHFTKEDFSKLTLEEIKAFGDDVNKIKINNKILIFYLIDKNKIEIIKNLIECSGGSSTTIDLNIKDSYGYTPLLEACYKNNLEIVTSLLLSGEVNVNFKNNIYGYTPLSWACHKNNFEMIELLLENGAIPEVDEEGNYECSKYIREKNKEKIRNFIFKFQTQNIKKCK